jgi:DNA polymerase III subunit epsilon
MLLSEATFVCLDLEGTGLDPVEDAIVEVAAARFMNGRPLERIESLIDPGVPIPSLVVSIHHITDEMVKGKPPIQEVLPRFLEFIKGYTLVGHAIPLDIAFLIEAAKRHSIPCSLDSQPFIDTLRLARLYGESPINSLEKLRQHFNIAEEGAHRAMNDVLVTIQVFEQLTKRFSTVEEVVEILKKPILLRAMPLGKHKGRAFSDIPLEYLKWASHQEFDQDLLFSIRSELKRRKRGKPFSQAGSPFSLL